MIGVPLYDAGYLNGYDAGLFAGMTFGTFGVIAVSVASLGVVLAVDRRKARRKSGDARRTLRVVSSRP